MTDLTLVVQGVKLKVCEMPGANESLSEALEHVPKNLHLAGRAKLLALSKKLADAGNLRMPEHFNKEAQLPNGSHFYAVKTNSTIRLRAYGWFSTKVKGTFIISHYAYKKGAKLDDRDTNRVIESWRRVENE
ncbi:hypothetical protein D3879_14845 [Pseudomonas cavernicola]|uniref:Type II toxin-antitoxin system RelE/ParE family toxin n=1 Tax=Pseudomonas cavernicola TaxID=2320866 RepID=A0A418XEJ0_9PSED|nr:hypothetical protein [Pseudomonas cavernicola]RJG10954.1 hypothetical protein D3879_14845 [Pseudomonas cavernicola]